jgi:hypothetical protein
MSHPFAVAITIFEHCAQSRTRSPKAPAQRAERSEAPGRRRAQCYRCRATATQ